MASRLCLRFIDALDVVEGTEEDLVARHITEQGRDDALQALVALVGAHSQQGRDCFPLDLVDALPRPVVRVHVGRLAPLARPEDRVGPERQHRSDARLASRPEGQVPGGVALPGQGRLGVAAGWMACSARNAPIRCLTP